jgi:ABC-2 type transport system ATP-binding protein
MCFKLKNGSVYGILSDAERTSAIAGLLAGAVLPTDGSVLINGFDLAKEARRAKAFLGYSPKSVALYDHMTPVEYLLFLADVRQI